MRSSPKETLAFLPNGLMLCETLVRTVSLKADAHISKILLVVSSTLYHKRYLDNFITATVIFILLMPLYVV